MLTVMTQEEAREAMRRSKIRAELDVTPGGAWQAKEAIGRLVGHLITVQQVLELRVTRQRLLVFVSPYQGSETLTSDQLYDLQEQLCRELRSMVKP